ncbi:MULTISPECIES: glycosyltransferase [unclassified Actinotalea]|uniref:glycosyltransferase n=1 Tax=unclassified Actinotalea TaxID=2638618 RepID=UPI0015F623ED|nr:MULTISPECIES: glycosyltransferase [unclassified Actinotalea]
MTLISLLLLPGQDGPDAGSALRRTAASVQRNGRGPWQLVAPSPDRGDAAREGATASRREIDRMLRKAVTWTRPDGDGPAAVLRAGLAAATGQYVAVLAPGDEIEPGVLAAMAEYVAARPATDVLYTDEQWPAPGHEGIQTKPHWVPRYLEGWDYLGRLCLVRRSLVAEVGGFRPEAELALEWDLHLRVAERTQAIEHVPVIGLTRPAAPPRGPEVAEAGRRAVADRYARLGIGATVEVAHPDGYVRVWRDVPDPPPLVSIVIPTGGGRRDVRGTSTLVLETCLRSLLERTTYPAWEVVLVPSEGTPHDVLELAAELVGDRLVVAPVTGEFSFSHSVNEGVRRSRGELVVLLNDDTEVIEPRWLDRMVAVAQDPDVGVVGAKLLFEDDTIQHVGIVHDDTWLPVHAHRLATDDASHFGSKLVDLDYLAVTGACLLTPRDLYVELGGFSEELPMAFNDVDYCHKVVAAGRDVVCTPFARLYHYESSSRVADVRPFERQYLMDHTLELAKHDPHINHRAVR